ncbi:tyrosine-type recombinase/integrase [Burkholderiaceae bacterium]|nr:tyrosine-type recombinase/integrase [Burkholderiaceae bacterium]
MASPKIDTVQARGRLKPQHDAYFVTISRGLALGYRKPSSATLGTWVVRVRDSATGATKRHSLGDYGEVLAAERYTHALRDAQRYAEHLRNGGSTAVLTVSEACAAYTQHLIDRGRVTTAKDSAGRYKRWVHTHPIGSVVLTKLTRRSVERWRTDLAQAEVVINPYAEKPSTRERSPASINRDMTALKAALNFAHDHGHVDSDNAWRVALKPIENATRRRETYLSAEERRRLLDAMQDDIKPMVQVMTLLPFRPAVFANFVALDFDLQQAVLRVERDKKAKDRRVPLPKETADLLEKSCANKKPNESIFVDRNGNPWNKDSWKKAFKSAAKAASLPETVTAYTLRHSVITDLISLHNLDINTVAIISGTSARMIEQYYGHLIKDRAVSALAKLR